MKSVFIALAAASMVFTGFAHAGGDAEAGKAKSATCAGCHGPTGVAVVPMYPTLAGQWEDYLYEALTQYKAGSRTNPIMAGMVAPLTDEDMRNLAAFYAAQDSSLTVTPHQ
ncbi:MAG: c-type cytochrome [Gammaproteobacteria bacterium]